MSSFIDAEERHLVLYALQMKLQELRSTPVVVNRYLAQERKRSQSPSPVREDGLKRFKRSRSQSPRRFYANMRYQRH
ncbi:hypothetical protein L596_010645 [Steinernema carpocapsae]|uniref:Uncharacterized protein n=1 Tax=Steinernema carpocapsae TaxID=34508 RepID=A0A4U5PJ61_STECR|nr:hypothetical protein L596_010645 [Steinernema carpocapsae]